MRKFLTATTCGVTIALSATVLGAGAANAIVGGHNVSTQEYPFVVQIQQLYKASNDTVPNWHDVCGGTVVAKNKILTAAHCLKGQTNANNFRIVTGRDDSRITKTGMTIPVDSIWKDPSFVGTATGKGHDVAVLTLAKPTNIKPVKLATGNQPRLYAEGMRGDVLGWGTVSSGGRTSEHLRRGTVSIYSQEQCRANYPGTQIANSEFCAGFPEGGVDACQGDSGGPLIVENTLVGIVSWGFDCAATNRAGVYAKVSELQPILAHQI